MESADHYGRGWGGGARTKSTPYCRRGGQRLEWTGGGGGGGGVKYHLAAAELTLLGLLNLRKGLRSGWAGCIEKHIHFVS